MLQSTRNYRYVDNPFEGSLDCLLPRTERIDLSTSWLNLLDEIAAEGRYVALDLSACTMSGTEFDPNSTGRVVGKSYIVSLVLPNAAVSIADGFGSDYAFTGFTFLETVSGANITSVGDNAFYHCDHLTTVSLPQATSIGEAAFAVCTGLTTVNLPRATSIGKAAFYACTSLSRLSLPHAISIGDRAFYDCTGLTTVSLPQAMTIGDYAFLNCTGLITMSLPQTTSIGGGAFAACTGLTALSLPQATSIGADTFEETGRTALTITLGASPPTVGRDMFFRVAPQKTVTVKVPSGSTTSYNSTWQTAFKGKGGGTSAANGPGTENSHITVNITAL
ncbi:MAG: leucine-rich repeat domain-containing protein [Treponema sp.]|jgi:hypothetical protein|nr:leucine-rich repeat domain-containing protein [Treponema sp.]